MSPGEDSAPADRASIDHLVALWAKVPRDTAAPPSYHPLLAHLIDVAQVAHAMWHRVLPPAGRSAITRAFGLSDDEAAGHWVAFLAGLHDLGKASPAFARQNARAWDRIRAAGYPCPPDPRGDRLLHGWITAQALPALLIAPPFTLSLPLAELAALTIGGHHGAFPGSGQVEAVLDDPGEAGRGRWRDARRDLVAALASALGYPRPSPGPQALDRVTAMYLAGLTSVADWIGSNTDFFPFAVQGADRPAEMGAARYWQEYAARTAASALDALRSLGWLGAAAPPAPAPFADLFPFAPNALQQAVVEIAGRLDGPALVVIEAPMGIGKTEAALFLADHLAATLGQRGFYLALPT